VLLERGLYFYVHERLGFSETDNLWLALAFGLIYTVGAFASHRTAERTGERRLLGIILLLLCGAHTLMAALPERSVLLGCFLIVAALQGMKWPIIESYVGSGLSAASQLRAVGRFNVAWALGVPLALASSGPLIGSKAPWLLFGIAALLNAAALAALPSLPAAPPHLEAAHPDRPPASVLTHYRPLLVSSRWSMLASYSLLFLLAALMPEIFQRLGQGVESATLYASLLDLVRVLTFALLIVFAGWHGRSMPLVLASAGLPLSFFLILFGPDLPTVLAGEVAFGVLSGLTYYAALYYAIVVRNAAVDAGGVHEALIGLGFAIGPAMGLVGTGLVGVTGSYEAGMLVGVGPLVLVCSLFAVRPFLRRSAIGGA
jgi:hypothetical protein